MSGFKDIFDQYNWDEVKAGIYSKTARDVEAALNSSRRTWKILKQWSPRPLLLTLNRWLS